MNTYLNPTPGAFSALFSQTPAATPVIMLNLLRFNDDARYGTDSGEPERSGREAYGLYAAAVIPLLNKAGGRVIAQNVVHHTVIGPADERWDEMLLVQYPSTEAFGDMVTSPAYQAIVHHRTAALADSRLIATTPGATGTSR